MPPLSEKVLHGEFSLNVKILLSTLQNKGSWSVIEKVLSRIISSNALIGFSPFSMLTNSKVNEDSPFSAGA